MQVVSQCNAASLLPIIQHMCNLGLQCTVMNGGIWASSTAANKVAHHSTVNRSITFIIDTITGIHTQNIESYWNCVKTKFKRNERGP